MSYPKDELDVPGVVREDPNSVELMRIWVAGTGEHVTLRPHAWEDPEQWGRMLAGVARYIARVQSLHNGRDTADALECVRRGFERELARPSDQPSAQVSG